MGHGAGVKEEVSGGVDPVRVPVSDAKPPRFLTWQAVDRASDATLHLVLAEAQQLTENHGGWRSALNPRFRISSRRTTSQTVSSSSGPSPR